MFSIVTKHFTIFLNFSRRKKHFSEDISYHRSTSFKKRKNISDPPSPSGHKYRSVHEGQELRLAELLVRVRVRRREQLLQLLRHLRRRCLLLKIAKNCFLLKIEIAAVQNDANLVELEKCCQTHISLQNFVLIQPRTSPPKICKILLIFPILLTLTPNAKFADRTFQLWSAPRRGCQSPARRAGPATLSSCSVRAK